MDKAGVSVLDHAMNPAFLALSLAVIVHADDNPAPPQTKDVRIAPASSVADNHSIRRCEHVSIGLFKRLLVAGVTP